MSDDARGRGLFIGSLVLSAIGLLLLISWLVGVRRWWVLIGGALGAIAGVAVAARARREPTDPPEDVHH